MPTQTWDNLPREKQERIVAAAAAEFAAHGFSSGSLNVIARDAEIAKGSLWQYFADKDELFGYVYGELAASTRTRLEVPLTSALTDARDVFDIAEALLYEFIVFHREHPLEGAILRAMTFESDERVRARLRNIVDGHYVDLISAVVEGAAADGQLAPGTSVQQLCAQIHLAFAWIGVAGISPELNPFVPLHELEGDELRSAIAGFVAPMRAYHGAKPSSGD